MTSEPSRRISSFSRPTALSSLSPRNELLQTSSASRSVLCTAVGRTGRISCSTTRHAARGGLPRRFAAGEAAADDVDHGDRLDARAALGATACAAPLARRAAAARACGAGAARRAAAPASARAPALRARFEQLDRLVERERRRDRRPSGSDALVVPSVTYGP